MSCFVTSSWIWIHRSRVGNITRQDIIWRICQRLEIPSSPKISIPTSFTTRQFTNSKEPQNAWLLIVVQKRSFPRESSLLYSTRRINNSKEEPPPSTGLLCRPVTWLILMYDVTHHTCDVTHSYVWQDSFICVTWRIHMCDFTPSHVWHDSLCDFTHSHVLHDSFRCATWRMYLCDTTHSYVWNDWFIYVTWLTHMCDIMHFIRRPHHRTLDLPHAYV